MKSVVLQRMLDLAAEAFCRVSFEFEVAASRMETLETWCIRKRQQIENRCVSTGLGDE